MTEVTGIIFDFMAARKIRSMLSMVGRPAMQSGGLDRQIGVALWFLGGNGINMKRWRWALLIFELFLFALILVLPQVDLPDFTFHRGTAPIVARQRISPPALTVVRAPTNSRPSCPFARESAPLVEAPGPSDSDSLLSRLCILLC
jgi:hypothetical protein